MTFSCVMTSNKIQSIVPFVWTNVLGMKFRLVKAGSFKMGSPDRELRRFADETLHLVFLTQDFFLCTTPTTQAEWRAVVGENPSYFADYKERPVESVSWFDCIDFIDRINSDEYALELKNFLGIDWVYSLPSEAQWEYACRAGTNSSFFFGDIVSENVGNFGSLSMGGTTKLYKGTCDVALFPPNAWGFFDMSGNICEWTLDGYADYDVRNNVDPLNSIQLFERVARGGSWRSSPENCRSASRFNFLPTYRGDNCGMRVAIVRKCL